MSSTQTLKTIFERVVDYCFPTILPRSFTATGGTTTTIVSTSANYNRTNAAGYDGLFATVTDDDSGTTIEGESRLITNWNNVTTTWTVEPAFSAAVASPDKITFSPLPASDIIEAVNDCIRTAPLPRWGILTLVTDGDMETSGQSNWSDVGLSTGTKVTTAGMALLRQALEVNAAADGAGSRSAAFDVQEGETLYIDVALRVTSAGEAQIELYNAGTAAVISGTNYETNERGFHRVSFQYTVGADIEQIQVQVTQNGASAMLAYISWVSVVSNRRMLYNLPSVITDASFFEGLYYLPKGANFEDDAYTLWERELEPWPHYEIVKDYAAQTSHRLEVETPPLGPLFVKYRAADTALSTMAGTTVFPLEELVCGAAAQILGKLALRAEQRGEALSAARLQERAKTATRTYKGFLRSLSIGEPIIRTSTQRRVSVGYR